MKIFCLLVILVVRVNSQTAKVENKFNPVEETEPVHCFPATGNTGICNPLNECTYLISFVEHPGQYLCSYKNGNTACCPMYLFTNPSGRINLGEVFRGITVERWPPNDFHTNLLIVINAGMLLGRIHEPVGK